MPSPSSEREDSEPYVDALLADYLMRLDAGESLSQQAFVAQHPEVEKQLNAYFHDQNAIGADHGGSPISTSQAAAVASGTPQLPFEQLRDYRLLEPLGRGGMGAVYRAVHVRLNKPVAIKILTGDRMRDPQAVARFQREMQAVGGLDHPLVVRALDAGDVDGVHYLVMELIEGVNFAQLVQALGPLSIADACELGCQAAQGLQYSYERGLVHRDIKPSNLMLTNAGDVKILDFGLATLRQQILNPDLTATGETLGTLDYIAPEQVDASSAVDIRADIYSLGCTLFVLLTGHAPLADDAKKTPIARLIARKTETPPDIRKARPEVPKSLAEAICRALAIQPGERFQTPEELRQALSSFTHGAELAQLAMRARDSKKPPAEGRLQQTGAFLSSSEVSTGKNLVRSSAPQGSAEDPSAHKTPLLPWPAWVRRRSIAASLVALGLLGFGWLLFGVITINTGWGQLRIESFSDDVEVQILQDGQEVQLVDSKTQSTVHLKPGAYDIALKGSANNVRLDRNHVELKRNRETLVRVTRTETANPNPEEASAVDRKAARWILDHRGTGRLLVGENTVPLQTPLPTENFAIQAIDLSNQPITDSDLASLAGLPELMSLNLTGTKATGAGFRHLKRSQKLREVRLATSPINDEGLQALASFPGIAFLILTDTSITDQGMQFVKPLHNLISLNLQKTIVGDRGLQYLSELSSLQSLSLISTRVTNSGLKYLRSLQALTEIGLQDTAIDDQAEFSGLFEGLPNLEYLSLDDTQVKSPRFLEGLKHCPKLRGISAPGGDELIDALVQMPFLRNLESLSLKPSTVSNVGIDRLSSMKLNCFRTWGSSGPCTNLSRLRNLKDLGLSGELFTDDTLKGIPELTHLHTIWLGTPTVTDDGLKTLQSCKTLKLLALTGVKVSKTAVEQLAEALPKCQIDCDDPLLRPSPTATISQDRANPKGLIENDGDESQIATLENLVKELAQKPGALDKAIKASKLLTEACRRRFGDDSENLAAAELELCQLYQLASKYDVEIPLAEHVLSIRKKLFGDKHLATLEAMWQLGLAQWGYGNFEQAAEISQTLHQEYSAQLGTDDVATIRAGTLLGCALLRLGRPEDAVAILAPTAERRSRTQGKTYAGTMETEFGLADAYMALGRPTKAQRIYESLLERAETMPLQAGNVFYYSRGLAQASELLGDHKRASDLLSSAVIDAEASQDVEKQITSLALLATSYRHQNRIVDSVSRSLDVLTKCKDAKDRYGDLANQFGTLASINLAVLSRESPDAASRKQAAEQLLDQLGKAISTATNRNGYAIHSSLLRTQGCALSELGRYNEALPVFHVLRSNVPANPEYWRFEALCLLADNRMDDYASLCEDMATEFASDKDVDVAASWAAASSLASVDSQIAAKWLRDLPPSIDNLLGIELHYLAEEYVLAIAIANLDEAQVADDPKALLHLSLCHAKSGQSDAAHRRLTQARDVLKQTGFRNDWHEQVVIRRLEARAASLTSPREH